MFVHLVVRFIYLSNSLARGMTPLSLLQRMICGGVLSTQPDNWTIIELQRTDQVIPLSTLLSRSVSMFLAHVHAAQFFG